MPYKDRLRQAQNKREYYKKKREEIRLYAKEKYAKEKGIQIGEVFTELTVISQAESKIYHYKNGQTCAKKMWNVKCNCGNEFSTEGTKLRRGDVIMCSSCAYSLRPQSVIKFEDFEIYYKKMVLARSNKKGIKLNLSLEEFRDIIFKDCFYCGSPPETKTYFYRKGYSIPINGIDRINNDLGYTKDNCVPCCKKCNTAKNNYSLKDFIEHIIKIYDYSELKAYKDMLDKK